MATRRSPKFFITHSWRDNNFARRLTDDLKDKGLEGFFDVYSIQPGDNIPSRISSGLDDCDVYIPVLSNTAFQSPWCEWEINAAIQLSNTRGRQGRPRIIPVLIDDCHAQIPAILRPVSYIDFTSANYADALRRLLKGMGVVVNDAKQAHSTNAETSKAALPFNLKVWSVVGVVAAMLSLIVLWMLFVENPGEQTAPLTIAPNTVASQTSSSPKQTVFPTSAPVASVSAPSPIPSPPEPIVNPLCPDPQFAGISFPSNGAEVSGIVVVRGTVGVKPFSQPYHYSLFYRPGIVREAMDGAADDQAPLSVGAPMGKNSPIQVTYFQPYDSSIVNVELGTWDTTKLASGWYSLRLWNKDRGGNYSGCDVYVYVKGQ